MAPLNPDGTARVYVDYSYEGQQHTSEWRYDAAAGDLDAFVAGVKSFYDQLAPRMANTWRIDSVRFANQNSPNSFPIGPFTVTPNPSESVTQVNFPRFVSFVGRGPTSGRRWRVFTYGLSFSTPSDYRLGTEEASWVLNARNALALLEPLGLVTIGGDMPIFNLYANVGFNSYYERKQRG